MFLIFKIQTYFQQSYISYLFILASIIIRKIQFGTQIINMKAKLKTFLILICLISIAFTDKQIDTFNILLPEINNQISGRPIQLITTQGGCFNWESGSPDMIGIKALSDPDNINCYRRAVIELKHVGTFLSSLFITATNAQNQQLSNYIPIRIRPIQKIQIIAKSKMMNRNQMQDLHIFAYDKEHNMFTSLEGLKFKWELIENNQVISKISLKNSQLILPLDQRKNIQRKGAQSDILMIKGQNPGKSIVRVQCIQPGYQHLKHEIVISVHERFDINPSLPTYLLVDSVYQFGLINPSRQPIHIPKSYYKMIMKNINFKVNNLLELKAPSVEDQTTLRVEDIRTNPPYYSQVQIFSKQPDHIVLKVDQYIVVGEEAKVDVELYWKNHLLKGEHEKYQIVTSLKYDNFKKKIHSDQRTVATVKAMYGRTLVAQKKVHVVSRLRPVLPSGKITLPIEQTFQVKVIGGSGIYEYQVAQNNIVTISASGVITSKKQGRTVVTVIDKKVQQNRAVIELIVSPISTLHPLELNKELNVNQFGQVYTIARTNNYTLFTKCSQQPILLQLSHLPTFQLNQNISLENSILLLHNRMTKSAVVKQVLSKTAFFPLGIQDFINKYRYELQSGDITLEQLAKYSEQLQNYGICSVHTLKGYQKYDGQIQVYTRSAVNIRTKFNLRVYEKIRNNIQNQTDDYFIMTPLAALDWKTQGGSYQWDKNIKTKTFVNGIEQYIEIPMVQCPQVQRVLQMKIQKKNIQTNNLLLPVTQSKTIYVQCKYPSSLKIIYEKQNLNSLIINGIQSQIIKGRLIPLDNKGEIYYNSSNLVYQHAQTAGSVKIQNYDNFQFDPKGSQSGKVTFWSETIYKIKQPFTKVSAYFNYAAKQMFKISPQISRNYLLTLYNPKRSYWFWLKNISQNVDIACQGSVECLYLTTQSQINLNTTKLGMGSLTIKDKTLYGYPSLIITFQVVNADQITVQTNKQMLQIHNSISAQVKLYYQGALISAWQYDVNNLMLVHQAGIRSSLTLNGNSAYINQCKQKARYNIDGQKAGVYRLTAQQHFPRYLQSKSLTLTVYSKVYTNIPNLQESYTQQGVLHLKGDISVAINCVRKVYIHGGPMKIKTVYSIQDEQVVQISYPNVNNSRQLNIFGIEQDNTNVMIQIYSSTQSSHLITIIELTVKSRPINYAMIYTLSEVIINAQFRILPYLIVDDQILLESTCELNYKWQIDSKLKMQVLDNKQQGMNATAVMQGQSEIQLEISNKDNQLLFTVSKKILVHKTLDIHQPTLIGERHNSISRKLLIPPNSGYTFQDSSIQIVKMSACQDNVLSISNNKLTTFRQKGVLNVKLQKSNDKDENDFFNVIITDIKAMFIQNNYNRINVELGKIKHVRFYVQDMYGRLFYNNLHNVYYEVISSNQDIFVAAIDQTNKFINIQPKKPGKANLILKLKSPAGTGLQKQKTNTLNKLKQIPHDIAIVQVGNIIEPQSPIYVLQGGSINLQYEGRSDDKWNVIAGEDNIEVDTNSRIIRAKRAGQAHLSISGYSVIVRVLEPMVKHKVVQKPKPGFNKAVIQFMVGGMYLDEFHFQRSIQNSYYHVNNNMMNIKCIAANQQFWQIKASVYVRDNSDKLLCQVEKSDWLEQNIKAPEVFEIVVVHDKKVIGSYKFDIHPTFWLQKKYQNILLTANNPKSEIIIRTNQYLDVSVINGQASWITNSFEDEKNYVILLNIDPSKVTQNRDFVIKLSNKKTDQVQEIKVKYIADKDEAARKEKEKKKQDERQGKQQKRQQKYENQVQGQDFRIHWTDFLILLMAIFFIIILFAQTCTNGDSKYKVL